MGRTKPSDIGRKWENDVRDYINAWAGRNVCERIRQRGKDDEGDIRLTFRGVDNDCVICVECKHRKQDPGPSEIQTFRDETDDELENSGADGAILVTNRFRKGRERAFVSMRIRTVAILRSIRNGRFYGMPAIPEPKEGEGNVWWSTSLLEFCWLCFGAPAWGDKREE